MLLFLNQKFHMGFKNKSNISVLAKQVRDNSCCQFELADDK